MSDWTPEKMAFSKKAPPKRKPPKRKPRKRVMKPKRVVVKQNQFRTEYKDRVSPNSNLGYSSF